MMYYDHLMALVTTTVNGEILAPVTNVPAVGTVTFKILMELRDTVDNVVYSPQTFVATLDAFGQFTIELPYTDNADITPTDWQYWVYVDTDIWTELFYISLPTSTGDPVDFADLMPLSSGDGSDCTPDGTACAPISVVTQLAALQAEVDALEIDVTGKVDRSGDTMTGDLNLDTNLQVDGDTNIDGTLTLTVTGTVVAVGQALIAGQSTSVLSGAEFTPNADPTKIDISATTGIVVDYDSSAPLTGTNPMITSVTWGGAVAVTPLFAPFTYFLLSSTGTLIQQANRPTATQRRQNISLGFTRTEAGIITIDQTLPVIPSQLNNQVVDLMEGMGPFTTSGNRLTANGANLSINKTAGNVFSRAFNQVPDYLDPHNSALPAQTPMNFRHITAVVGSAGALTTLLNVANYDPGGLGVVTPVGGGANTSTNFRIFAFANNNVNDQILIQYGQNTYASLAAAVQNIPAGTYTPNPVTNSAVLLGWISVIRTATNLSDITQAVFTFAPKFATP